MGFHTVTAACVEGVCVCTACVCVFLCLRVYEGISVAMTQARSGCPPPFLSSFLSFFAAIQTH